MGYGSFGITCTHSGIYDPCPLMDDIIPYFTGTFFGYNLSARGDTFLSICWSPLTSGPLAQWTLTTKSGECAIYLSI
jgi:hypothetical protein